MTFAELLKKTREVAETSTVLWPDNVVQETDGHQVIRVLGIPSVAELHLGCHFQAKNENASVNELERAEQTSGPEALQRFNDAVRWAPERTQQLVKRYYARDNIVSFGISITKTSIK